MQLPHRIILMTGWYIFEDSGAPFIITTKEIAEERRELFAKLPCTVLLIEELLENENTENPQVKIGSMIFVIVSILLAPQASPRVC